MKIMIVEDNDLVRGFLVDAMTEISRDIIACTDGIQAVDQYAKQKPDVVLMDIRMPGMDGIQATEMIVRANPGAIVLMLTDHDLHTYKDAARKSGATAYFLKKDLIDVQEYVRHMTGKTE